MVSINIICVGKLKEQYLKEAVMEYSKRLSKYCNLNIIEIPDEKLPDKISPKSIEEIKCKEGNKILSSIKKDSYTIALDLGGKQYKSEEFSEKLEWVKTNGYSTINFVIGGTVRNFQRSIKYF